MAVCKYRNVSERDMDLLFMEAFATDPKFVELFLNQTGLYGKPFKVVQVERSKIDSGLGETDITLLLEVDGEKHSLLIEDKSGVVIRYMRHMGFIRNKGGIGI